VSTLIIVVPDDEIECGRTSDGNTPRKEGKFLKACIICRVSIDLSLSLKSLL
jgi:hypothetical protein